MVSRRTLLAGIGGIGVIGSAGCIETLTGGRVFDGADQSSLTGQRGEVASLYEEAVIDRNDGIALRDEAVTAFNDEAYERSIGRFETAIDRFEAAIGGFSEAIDLARDLGEDEAASICERAERETDLQLTATEAGLDAAIAARDGTGASDVNEYVGRYQETVEEADAIDVDDPQALADVLQS